MAGGDLIARRYRLEERLGAGGMGVVWRATDMELRRVVALKRSQGGDGAQIRREARLGASLNHPNIVTVFDSVIDGDDRWLVMEYLPARSLEVILGADGPLPVERVAAVGTQIAAALAAMHAGEMVHRDITPGNILIADDGTAKLADLGISQWAAVTVTGSAQAGGTAGYVAPEVANGHEAGSAADMFSLGATLFAALEGVSPWGSGENGPFAQLRRAADYRLEPTRRSDTLAPVLDALLSKQPGRRPSAVEAQELLSGGTSPSRRPARLRPRTRRRVLSGAAIVAVAALAGGFLVFTDKGSPPADAAVGLVGDAHTADPCSLLSVNSLAPYGKVFLEPNLGDFNRCDLDTVLPENGGTIVTSLTLAAQPEYQETPAVPGRLGAIERPGSAPGKCERYFDLPDTNMVTITSVRTDNNPSGQLCAMVDAVVGDGYAKVVSGPIGRRQYPFDPGSLARIDACTLLDGATVDRTVGNHPIDRYFGNWSCSWGSDAESIDLYYDREWPFAQDPPDDQTRTRIGQHPAYVNPYEKAGDQCDVTIDYRTYSPVIPPLKGEPAQRDELVLLQFTDEANKGRLDTICATAKSLATVVVSRFPPT